MSTGGIAAGSVGSPNLCSQEEVILIKMKSTGLGQEVVFKKRGREGKIAAGSVGSPKLCSQEEVILIKMKSTGLGQEVVFKKEAEKATQPQHPDVLHLYFLYTPSHQPASIIVCVRVCVCVCALAGFV